MSDEVAKLRRRVRQLERSRDSCKGRCAAKQHHIRYLRVKARDLANSRQRCKSLACAPTPPTAPPPTPVLLPLPCPSGVTPLGEP